jgi:hypothetical protein
MIHDKYEGLLNNVKSTTNRDPKWDGTTDTLKAFSELLVEVIRDTERQSRINLGLQKWVCILTIILTVFTAILLWIGLVQIKLIHINQNPPTEMQTKE